MFNKLTLLVSLIELSEVGVSAHDEVVDTPNFYPFNVLVAGLDKVVVEYTELRLLLFLRSLNHHFSELHLDIIDCCK